VSRTIRLTMAAVALATVAAPAVSASATPPPPRPICTMYWGEPILTTSSDFPVQFTVYRPEWAC
jgi:hypothetical protein